MCVCVAFLEAQGKFHENNNLYALNISWCLLSTILAVTVVMLQDTSNQSVYTALPMYKHPSKHAINDQTALYCPSQLFVGMEDSRVSPKSVCVGG